MRLRVFKAGWWGLDAVQDRKTRWKIRVKEHRIADSALEE